MIFRLIAFFIFYGSLFIGLSYGIWRLVRSGIKERIERIRREEKGRANFLREKPRTTYKEICSVCNNKKGMILPDVDYYFAGEWTHADCATGNETKERERVR